MERLTKYYAKGITTSLKDEIICSNYCNMCSRGTGDCTIVKHMVERLAAIEDILSDKYDLDRLKELVKADREGRCITLPCKIGDTIYTIGASICKWREIDHCDEYCDGQQYRDCWEGESTVLERKFSLYDLGNFGKTVFLTREEAEAALEKMKEDK